MLKNILSYNFNKKPLGIFLGWFFADVKRQLNQNISENELYYRILKSVYDKIQKSWLPAFILKYLEKKLFAISSRNLRMQISQQDFLDKINFFKKFILSNISYKNTDIFLSRTNNVYKSRFSSEFLIAITNNITDEELHNFTSLSDYDFGAYKNFLNIFMPKDLSIEHTIKIGIIFNKNQEVKDLVKKIVTKTEQISEQSIIESLVDKSYKTWLSDSSLQICESLTPKHLKNVYAILDIFTKYQNHAKEKIIILKLMQIKNLESRLYLLQKVNNLLDITEPNINRFIEFLEEPEDKHVPYDLWQDNIIKTLKIFEEKKLFKLPFHVKFFNHFSLFVKNIRPKSQKYHTYISDPSIFSKYDAGLALESFLGFLEAINITYENCSDNDAKFISAVMQNIPPTIGSFSSYFEWCKKIHSFDTLDDSILKAFLSIQEHEQRLYARRFLSVSKDYSTIEQQLVLNRLGILYKNGFTFCESKDEIINFVNIYNLSLRYSRDNIDYFMPALKAFLKEIKITEEFSDVKFMRTVIEKAPKEIDLFKSYFTFCKEMHKFRTLDESILEILLSIQDPDLRFYAGEFLKVSQDYSLDEKKEVLMNLDFLHKNSFNFVDNKNEIITFLNIYKLLLSKSVMYLDSLMIAIKKRIAFIKNIHELCTVMFQERTLFYGYQAIGTSLEVILMLPFFNSQIAEALKVIYKKSDFRLNEELIKAFWKDLIIILKTEPQDTSILFFDILSRIIACSNIHNLANFKKAFIAFKNNISLFKDLASSTGITEKICDYDHNSLIQAFESGQKERIIAFANRINPPPSYDTLSVNDQPSHTSLFPVAAPPPRHPPTTGLYPPGMK